MFCGAGVNGPGARGKFSANQTMTPERSKWRPSCRFAIALLAAASALAIFPGNTMTAKAADTGGEILIGLVTKTEVNPYFVKLREAATAEAEKQGAKLSPGSVNLTAITKGRLPRWKI